MAMDDMFSGDGDDDEEQTTNVQDEQKKTLIANAYNTTGQNDPDPYKELDWNLNEEEIRMAYLMTAPRSSGSAVVQNTLDSWGPGGHEEWYSELQVKLAHIFGDAGVPVPEFDEQDIEPEGAVPMMEFLGLNEDDILQFLSENQEVAQEVYEALHEARQEEEAAEAEADD